MFIEFTRRERTSCDRARYCSTEPRLSLVAYVRRGRRRILYPEHFFLRPLTPTRSTARPGTSGRTPTTTTAPPRLRSARSQGLRTRPAPTGCCSFREPETLW